MKVEKDNLSKSIPLQDGVIQQLEREIEYLIANKEYQTEQQQQETDGQIDTKKNLIEMAEVEKEEMKKLLREVNERIENLEKKKNDQLEKLAKE
ncbi:hypothetical protein E2L07_16100 [Halalkalibacterium halodurans]|uniref:hypothetical protein n=1 Tax=Halalkalibacterium halodurans TaxID=86665 RepID=UPI001068158A|nr:hypothetical protein [Halalkalibacterium halodurans]TES50314.1 hypothetical protein E2L07_16100 [Halalkalibacterium halodurans]